MANRGATAPTKPFWILAYDVGSTSTRSMLFDGRAKLFEGSVSQIGTPLRRGLDGAAEIDPAELLQALAHCIDRTLQLAGPRAGDIAGVCGATLVTNVLALGADGTPITPLFTYADVRGASDARALRRRLQETDVHQRTGCMLRASYLPALFAWLARTSPALLRDARRWVSFGEFLMRSILAGDDDIGVSYSVASWSGLLNRHELGWDAELLAHLEIPERCLAPLVEADRSYTGLRPEWARRWPALRDVPWFVPIGDGAAANLGSGGVSSDRIALTIGTTGAMRVLCPARPKTNDPRTRVAPIPKSLWEYRGGPGCILVGGATNEGGSTIAWLRRCLQLPDPPALEAHLASMPPDAHGLTILPFLAGERSPGWNGDARGLIDGLNLHTQPLHLVRAMLEAIAYRFAVIHRDLEDYLAAIAGTREPQRRPVIASGGALRASPAWMQILADVLDRTVVASAESASTARGAVLVVLRAMGALADLEAAPAALGIEFQPNAERHARYLLAVERQQLHYVD
jgi:gluconokinase